MIVHAIKRCIAVEMKKIFPRLWMECELRFRPHLLEKEFWLVPSFCDKKKTAIDVGAAMGCYAYFMAKFSKNVIAFEPNSNHWKNLRNLFGGRIHLEGVALSDQAKQTVLRVVRDNYGLSTIETKNQLAVVGSQSDIDMQEVEAKPLDSFQFSDVSLIKIDVEGHEEAVVNGARETIDRNRPVLLIESEDRHNPGAPRRLAEWFFERDYRAYYLKNQHLMDFSTLREEDTNPENLVNGSSDYINNFLFIPAEQKAKIECVQTLLSSGALDA
jgi:FkbM family methyltransferase